MVRSGIFLFNLIYDLLGEGLGDESPDPVYIALEVQLDIFVQYSS